ncbi:hypothetical protein [Pseudovibrio sp. WM33]|uniref:hypothetical protein n=1 Tax=Pseudovibrio sp. WM33 TaxID=1735585 RepID=UPI0007AE651C|nr:hypothetical protein [Pseudovibrio sp. WM33]KZL18134.1 hypothetical protein PsWM33_05121 [Pseudovibrio sp. WM33]
MRLLFFLVWSTCFSIAPTQAKSLSFLCSWDNRAPITIELDTQTRKAKRSDGGSDYTLIKITEQAVWLSVDQHYTLAVQSIERNKDKGGKWIDIIHFANRVPISISGGICWEQPK